MIKCCDDCIPCCDFCIHTIHEEIELNDGVTKGGPIGCALHKDDRHQEIAYRDGYCDDFHCFIANQE